MKRCKKCKKFIPMNEKEYLSLKNKGCKCNTIRMGVLK